LSKVEEILSEVESQIEELSVDCRVNEELREVEWSKLKEDVKKWKQMILDLQRELPWEIRDQNILTRASDYITHIHRYLDTITAPSEGKTPLCFQIVNNLKLIKGNLQSIQILLSGKKYQSLILIFGSGGIEESVDVEDPERITLRYVLKHLASEGRLPKGYESIDKISVVHGNERKPLDLDIPVARLGLPDNAILKVIPTDVGVGVRRRVNVISERHIPYMSYGMQNRKSRKRVTIPSPKDPFYTLKLKLAQELRELGFEPISGEPESVWIWRGKLCGTTALIVLPRTVDAENPVELWIRKSFCNKVRWHRFLEEREMFDGVKSTWYRKVCIYPYDAQIHGALIEFLRLLKAETGYECPELRESGV